MIAIVRWLKDSFFSDNEFLESHPAIHALIMDEHLSTTRDKVCWGFHHRIFRCLKSLKKIFITLLLYEFCCSPHNLNVIKQSLAVMSSTINLQFLHLPLCRISAKLSVKLDLEMAIKLTMSMNLILYIMVFPFPCFSTGTEKVYISLYFLPNISVALQTLLPVLWLWNGNQSLIHCERPWEFLLASCTLNYRYCLQSLYICLCNSSDCGLFHYYSFIIFLHTFSLDLSLPFVANE